MTGKKEKFEIKIHCYNAMKIFRCSSSLLFFFLLFTPLKPFVEPRIEANKRKSENIKCSKDKRKENNILALNISVIAFSFLKFIHQYSRVTLTRS